MASGQVTWCNQHNQPCRHGEETFSAGDQTGPPRHHHGAVGCSEDEKSTGTGFAAAYEADLGLGCDCGVLFAARCVWRGEQLAAGGLVEFGVINHSKLLQLWRVARRLNTLTAIVCRYPDTLGIGANLHKQLR